MSLVFIGQAVNAAENPSSSATEPTSAVQISNEQQLRIAQYQDQIALLETEYGGFDRILLEPLQGLTAALIEVGELNQVDRLLERRLQLLRTLEGPSSLVQLPVVAELIENDIRREDWKQVRDRFEYRSWLHFQDPAASPETLLNIKDNTIDWYHAAINLDEPNARISNFYFARELERESFLMAEGFYAQNSPALIPWLYRRAIMQYQVVAFLLSEDELGADAKYQILQKEVRSVESYLRESLNAVKQIREILEQQGNPEAEAMAMIYEADFQMLLGLGTARRLYRTAMDKLHQAGRSELEVAAFFQRPVIIPVESFHHTLDDALKQQNDNGYNFETPGADGADSHSVALGKFIAWNESLPFASLPPFPQLAASASLELHQVDLEFSISSTGTVRNPDVIFALPDEVRIRRDAMDAVKAMQFRPQFSDGRWRRINDVKLSYFYPPPK